MKRFSSLLVLLAVCSPAALAQPDINNAPKAVNPQNRRPADVAQRQKMAQEERVRNQLKKFGLVDDKQLDAVAAFVNGEMAARDALVEKGIKLSQVVKNDALTAGQTAAALNDYQAALDDEKVRHDKAVTELQKTVDLSKMPRVEAWLTLTGLVGNGPEVVMAGPRRLRARENVKANAKETPAKDATGKLAAPQAGALPF
jgi:hypothetical protein